MPTKVAVLIAHFCKVIKKCFETAAQTAKCFQNRLKRLRAPRNAFKILGNLRALRETLSKSSETSARSAKRFQNPRKPPRAPRNAFKILGNLCALRETLSKSSETSARSAKRFQNPRKPPRALRNAFRDVGNLYVQQNKGGTLHLLNHPTLTEGSPFADLN